MRADRNDPRQVYVDFADWLNSHPIWIVNIVLGFVYYLATTEEV